MTNPKAWRALIARAVEANNNEVAAGTGMTPNDYMERFVQDGKQSVAKAVDGSDTERTAKAERELERQQELTVGTRVRLVNTATQKAELRGARKMQARFSQEVFTVASVSKQSRKGSGNVSYLYGLKRANGQEKEGRYHREQLQIVPEMRTEWNPGKSKGRPFIDELRRKNVISGWDEKHNRFERTGNTWSEQQSCSTPATVLALKPSTHVRRRAIRRGGGWRSLSQPCTHLCLNPAHSARFGSRISTGNRCV